MAYQQQPQQFQQPQQPQVTSVPMGLSKSSMMASITQQSGKNWFAAICTALGAYGNFPTPPQWWSDLSTNKLVQYITLWMFVFQGRGNTNYIWTTLIATVVYIVMNLSDVVSWL